MQRQPSPLPTLALAQAPMVIFVIAHEDDLGRLPAPVYRSPLGQGLVLIEYPRDAWHRVALRLCGLVTEAGPDEDLTVSS